MYPKVQTLVRRTPKYIKFWPCESGHAETRNEWLSINGKKFSICGKCGKKARLVDEID